MKIGVLIIVAVLIIFGIFFFYGNERAHYVPEDQAKTEAYIRARISELSPKKEVLGGRFFVTNVTFIDDSNGVVEYEDGYVSYKAHFMYKVEDDSVQLSSFTVEEHVPETP